MILNGVITRPRGRELPPGIVIGIILSLAVLPRSWCAGAGQYGYFTNINNSTVVLTQTVWNIHSPSPTGFSFRTCSNGELLYQSGTNGDVLQLLLVNGTIEFHYNVGVNKNFIVIGQEFNNNEWFTVNSQLYLGNVYLNISQGGNVKFSEIISNDTHRTFLRDVDLAVSEGLHVGRGYTGCFMEGPNVQFTNNIHMQWANVVWSNSSCSVGDTGCAAGDVDACLSLPCQNGATCADTIDDYTCTCAHLFNGTNCENDLAVYGCLVEPCLNGGTCVTDNTKTNNYRCQCRQGYAGGNCEADINECGTNPCKNGAPCTDLIGNFMCNCSNSGYNGELCNMDVDECGSSPCGQRGTCHNNPGSFTCACTPGYFGNQCQQIDECQSNPCQHSLMCEDLDNDYNCVCLPGYSGKQCDDDIDECVGEVCSGLNSECRNLVNNYSCVCKAGYYETQSVCVDIDECQPDPCLNGAVCANLVNDYHCACPPGYEGKNCSTDIDDCNLNPCQNDASCEDHINNYTCSCLEGFEGRNCGTNIDECAQHLVPCNNGGTCHDLINGYNCSCLHGYTGSTCQQDINECDPDPCIATHSNGCTDGIGVFNCSCLPGYAGDHCETDINECTPNPCQNGASCTDLVNGYNCTCLPVWMGERCQHEYDACSTQFANCQNGASCSTVKPSNIFNCSCVLGFEGQRCEHNIDDCIPDLCQSPNVCHDGINTYVCACPTGFEGTGCGTDINECRSSPCLNGATCKDHIGSYTCECPQANITVPDPNAERSFLSGFKGDNCENDIDECFVTPSICLNNGQCENRKGGFKCLCGSDEYGNLFTGFHCEVVTSYCFVGDEVQHDPPACKNNGTCNGNVNPFICYCVAGFTDRRCQTDIDECESNPCQMNGTCDDRIDAYVCSCIDGITGANCQTNIDECESNPCLHTAPCIDGINEFTCNCTDTGFKGETCNENIDDCEPQPCQHGANCTDGIKNYTCNCFPGYSGKNCEIDNNECLENPCDKVYNGTCYEKSNRIHYELDVAGFENLNFSYANASGYICQCIKGITGVDCDFNIDDCVDDNCNNGTCYDLIDAYKCHCFPGYEGNNCENEINECQRYDPCGNRGSCTDKIADYDCDCHLMNVAGKNCTFILNICNNHNCQHDAGCVPFLVDEMTAQQDYTCTCTDGFTGRYCDVSTTMSFHSGSYINVTLENTNDVSLSFSFRTTLLDSLLLAWQDADTTGLFLTVELKSGNLHLLYHHTDQVGVLSKMSINRVFSNAEWQTVSLRVIKQTSFLTLTVNSSSCQTYECIRMASYDSQILPFENVYIGNVNYPNLLPHIESGTPFVGCMQDVTYAGNKLVLDSSLPTMFNQLSDGCTRQEQCFADTCNKQGHCVDLWVSFACDCRRPYLGHTCDTAYIAATFAYNNTISWATFDLPRDILKDSMNLSFFLRSRKPDGLILFLGNVTSNYLSVELVDGYIVVRMKFCGPEDNIFSINDRYVDGQQHFIELVRDHEAFNFSVDGHLNQQLQLQSDCFFYANKILFGDPNQIQNARRKKRQAIIVPDDVTSVENFKGIIQDVRLNSQSLQFFPLLDQSLTDLQAINASGMSELGENGKTDPICEMYSPCENNSTCSNVFYNDYSCECLHGYRGKNCSELDFCFTGKCPDGSTCQSLLDGFECVSIGHFLGQHTNARYTHTLSNTSVMETITFKFRTTIWNGFILDINAGTDVGYYTVYVIGSHIVVLCKLDGVERSLEALYDISDSKWYEAIIAETTGTLTLTLFDRDRSHVLSNVSTSIPTTGESLTSILMMPTVSIFVGNPFMIIINPTYLMYQGCLTEMRIGKILLPFFADDKFINNTSVERFSLHKGLIEVGCETGYDTNCAHNQCRHGSECIKDYYSYRCNCSAGFEGEWCQDRHDYCIGNSCENGHCVSRTDGYECQCPSGYKDSRCETDVDECAAGVCQNNVTCNNQNGTYTCTCSDLYVGDNCTISLNRSCSDNPCMNGQCINITNSTTGDVESFNCSCDAGYKGYTCAVAIDYCAKFPCLNEATCNSQQATQSFNCSCVQGYTGDTCDANINDCPTTSPCQHGGVCVDGLDTYVCNCTDAIYWIGEHCEVNIDECTVLQPCRHQSTCIESDDGYSCDCSTGYEGRDCENDTDECKNVDQCENDGECTNTDGSYECNCTVGYEGQDCGRPNCTGVPCVNNATCVNNSSTWTCECVQYYEGEFCEIRGKCLENHCFDDNTQTCTQNTTADTFECHCNTGWEGTTCDTDINECNITLNICANGGTCVNLNGSYRCDCVFGYNGTNCTIDIDDCADRPCQNNGICIDGVGEFTCNCTETGYTNLTCLEDINECEESVPCLHDGTCSNTNGSYECACMETYEGKDCEIKLDAMTEDDNITWYIVGPSVAVVLLLIVIGVIWFLMCVRNKRATRGAYSPSRQEVTGSRVELGNVLKKPPPERLI